MGRLGGSHAESELELEEEAEEVESESESSESSESSETAEPAESPPPLELQGTEEETTRTEMLSPDPAAYAASLRKDANARLPASPGGDDVANV